MTIPNEILGILINAGMAYGVIQVELRKDFARRKSPVSSQSMPSDTVLRTALSRLQKRGLVTKKRDVWDLTKAGRSFILHRIHRKKSHKQPRSYGQEQLIVAFDIPERDRNRRNWLRAELTYLEFKQLQKSVWVGPAPLPESFLRLLAEYKILEHMKFFEVQKSGII